MLTILRLIGGQLVKVLPGTGAKRIIAELTKNGGKIIRFPKGKPPSATNVTSGNLNKIIQGGRGKPATAKPVAKKPTAKKPTAKPTTAKPNPGAAKKGGLKTKKRTIPKDVKVNKIPKNAKPFKPKTKKQKEAQKKREETQAQNSKNSNRRNPSRDGVGKYNQRSVGRGNVPRSGGAKKGGLKTKLNKKSGGALAGLGIAAVKVDNLTQEELKIKKKDNLKPRTSGPNKGSRGSEGDRFKNRTMKKPTPKKIPVVKAPPGPSKERPKESQQPKETFGQAFNRNRKAGKPTFTFKDKKYTTRLKEESIEKHKKKFGVTGKY